MAIKKSFREILQENERKTKFVIFNFILLYSFIGLIADILIHAGHKKTFSMAFYSLITFNSLPVFTIIMAIVGTISVLVAFKLHDQIMLWGTDYIEIDPNNGQKLEPVYSKLYNIIEELKIAANLEYMPKVYLIDAPYMNAFASGYSEKSAMVAITRGLMEKLNRSEIQAVMAHEISHIKHMDIKLTLFTSVLSNIMLLVVDWLFETLRFTDRRDSNSGNARAIASLVILALKILLPFITLVLTLYLSRTREYMADAGAVKLTRDNQAMASALLKIHNHYSENEYEDSGISVRKAAYIYNPLKSSFSDALSTHPSLENRLKMLGIKRQDVEV